MDKDRVLITGIGGFIAQHVAIAALERGYRVRGTVRSMTRADETRKTLCRHVPEAEEWLEFMAADLGRDAGWREAAADCRFVLHVASPFPLQPPKDETALIGQAKEGTLRVLKAAAEAGCARAVVTSSMAAIVYDGKAATGECHYDETDWSKVEGKRITAYSRSKTLAERAAWTFVENSASAMTLTTICPGFVLGPLPGRISCTSAMVIADLLRGKYPALPNAGYMVVDVRDVAVAHLEAMECREAAGERFSCTGDYMTMREIAMTLAARFPEHASKLPKFVLPDLVVRLASRFDRSIAAVLPDLGVRRHVSNRKAGEILGIGFRPAREAVEEMGQSVIDHGLV